MSREEAQQFYYDEYLDRSICFVDKRSSIHSTKAKAKDITIVSELPTSEKRRLQADIAVDIGLNQGHALVGIRRNI